MVHGRGVNTRIEGGDKPAVPLRAPVVSVSMAGSIRPLNPGEPLRA